jgi:Rps23 Pro-64 3,4-dihydroxylase Tpa1-like proline 4-hydroxylase
LRKPGQKLRRISFGYYGSAAIAPRAILLVAFQSPGPSKAMLNPNLDKKQLARDFAIDGRLRIDDILDPDYAERVRDACLNSVPFEYVSYVDGENIVIPAESMAKMDPAEAQALQSKVVAAASEGVGFFYCGYMMDRARKNFENDDMRLLHSMFDLMNDEEMLSLIDEITGREDLFSAEAQFTRYTSGQFLTRHRDDITGDNRRIAYVMAFSKNWHPDWGGLLQFYEDDGTPRDMWMPKFNSMSIFDIRHVHSVSYVTPFAAEQRLSLTGWFRSSAPKL